MTHFRYTILCHVNYLFIIRHLFYVDIEQASRKNRYLEVCKRTSNKLRTRSYLQ